MSDDRHRCLAGPKCRNPDILIDAGRYVPPRLGVPAPPTPDTLCDGCVKHVGGARTADPDTLCDGCVKHVESCCHQLPDDWLQLRASLGERPANGTDFVRATPSPAIPINTTAEAIMVAICEVADRAAAMVSDRLHANQPATYHGRGFPRLDWRALHASVLMVEPNIDLLIGVQKQDAMVWTMDGEGFTLTQHSGIDVALQICNVHRAARAHLGHTRLRRRYPMPCPAVDKHGIYCGAMTVGQDDGSGHVDCKTCGTTWTETEYDFLAGLTAEEVIGQHYTDPNQRLEAYRMLRWLVAEAYWRLDQTQAVLDRIDSRDNLLDVPGAGRVIHERLTAILEHHQRPADRKTAA